MAKDKKSFILYSDIREVIGKLPKDKAGELFMIILDYVNDEEPIIDDLLLQIAFEPIKLQLKRDLIKWEKEIENKSIGGRMGNLKRWNIELYFKVVSKLITLEEAEQIAGDRIPSHTDTNQSHSIASIAVNDNVNVSVIDNVNVIKEKKYNIAAWANDFDIYLTDLRNAYTEIQEDSEWIEQQKKFYNNTVDIIKSIEKSCVNYWATEAGWQKKRKSKPQPKKINWKTTFANAISLGSNKVYIKQANSNKPHINNLTGDEEYTIF